jgi:hypothetical protein
MSYCGWKAITAAAQDMVLGWTITEGAVRVWAKRDRLQVSECSCGRPYKRHPRATFEAVVRAIGTCARAKARQAHRTALGEHAKPQSSETVEVVDSLGNIALIEVFGRRRLTRDGFPVEQSSWWTRAGLTVRQLRRASARRWSAPRRSLAP